MYVTTVYDLAKDCNMMLDKSLIDCFEEIKIDSEQLDELVENYNQEQQLVIINTTYENNELNMDNNLDDTLTNQQNNYEKLNKNKIHNYLIPSNEKEREQHNKRTGKNDPTVKRNEHFKNRTNRTSNESKEFIRRKRTNYNRRDSFEQLDIRNI